MALTSLGGLWYDEWGDNRESWGLEAFLFRRVVFVGSAGFGLDSQLQAIVVGSSSDEFVRDVLNLSGRYDLDTVLCEDVYSGICKLGEALGGVVVGRHEELAREDGRFFDVARRYGFTCCCFVDKNVAGRQRELLKAMEHGALLVTELGKIDELLMELADRNGAHESRARGDGGRGLIGRSPAAGASGLLKDEFLMTKAELDALLGA